MHARHPKDNGGLLGVILLPRIAPWSYFTRSLRDSLSSLGKVVGTSTSFIVTVQDGYSSIVRLFNRANALEQGLAGLRMSDLTGLDILHSTQPIVIPDTLKHAKGSPLVERGIGAFMSVPIILGERNLFGTLCTVDTQSYNFSKTELHAFELAANMIAYVIDLERTAIHDTLTGALNRLFIDRFSHGLQQEFGDSFALAYIDLDGFKAINDQYGHECGDSVLRVIVQRLKRRIRMEDVVVRVGGDEFVVLLTGMWQSEATVRSAVGRLHRSLDVDYAIGQHTFHVSASVGVSTYPQNGSDFESLIKAADRAMYQVKHRGGHGFAIHEDAFGDGDGRLGFGERELQPIEEGDGHRIELQVGPRVDGLDAGTATAGDDTAAQRQNDPRQTEE